MIANTQIRRDPNELSESELTTEVDVFYDGACPLCLREINLLKWLDRKKRIGFIDIAAPNFDPADIGVSYDALMEEIHGRLPDGRLIKGVEVFRRLYAAVGFRWLVAPTRWPGISHVMDLGYRIFAKNRLRLTGRCHAGTCDLRTHDSQ